jgi:hypothetical protein
MSSTTPATPISKPIAIPAPSSALLWPRRPFSMTSGFSRNCAIGEGGREWGMGVTGNGRFRFHQQLVVFARHIEMVDDIAHKIMIG